MSTITWSRRGVALDFVYYGAGGDALGGVHGLGQ